MSGQARPKEQSGGSHMVRPEELRPDMDAVSSRDFTSSMVRSYVR